MHQPSRLVSVTAALVLSACVVADGDEAGGDEDTETTAQALTTTNGVNLNGVNLNGVNLNGVNLNGVTLNGTSASGVAVGASGLSMVKAGVTYSGAGAVGAKLTGTLSNGGTLRLRVVSATLLPGAIWAYKIEGATETSAWANICPDETLAIAIAGRWDYQTNVAGAGGWIADSTALTFGCRGYAIAKCVEWGYAPWKTVGGVLLRDHHQACVRMVRGDYCGNGFAWTEDGTPINLYDTLGVQADSAAWAIDAEWTAAGAKCLNKARKFATADTACLKALRDKTTCGTFGTGVLLIDEYWSVTTLSGGMSSTTSSASTAH